MFEAVVSERLKEIVSLYLITFFVDLFFDLKRICLCYMYIIEEDSTSLYVFEVIRLFLYFIDFLSDLKRTKFAGNEWKIRMEMCTDVNLKTSNW